MDPTNIYDVSGSYDVTLTASNQKKSEVLTQAIVINDPTILDVYTYEDDTVTVVADVSVWIFDSEASYTNDSNNPQYDGFTDAEGALSFYNLESQPYIVDVYKETETGYWWGVYDIPALTLNTDNGWQLIMVFEESGSKKGLTKERTYRRTRLPIRSIEK